MHHILGRTISQALTLNCNLDNRDAGLTGHGHNLYKTYRLLHMAYCSMCNAAASKAELMSVLVSGTRLELAALVAQVVDHQQSGQEEHTLASAGQEAVPTAAEPEAERSLE